MLVASDGGGALASGGHLFELARDKLLGLRIALVAKLNAAEHQRARQRHPTLSRWLRLEHLRIGLVDDVSGCFVCWID